MLDVEIEKPNDANGDKVAMGRLDKGKVNVSRVQMEVHGKGNEGNRTPLKGRDILGTPVHIKASTVTSVLNNFCTIAKARRSMMLDSSSLPNRFHILSNGDHRREMTQVLRKYQLVRSLGAFREMTRPDMLEADKLATNDKL
ncbi:hypothetical protein L6452_26337 [Arctium lappa]|uniref:Uncharacterized protein n=1 Tax=Arctium lappa TaxID=4217 RepID=A0ACB9ADC9_ARCLA|nr:hypothetical protein L6452_26337 [Arctium lappa]